MSTSSNDYHISFFKPTTPQAKANRNMVVLLFCIWAVAIFGFHFLLKIIEKPVPENELITFQNVWPQVEQGNATSEEIAEFARVTMSVLGKVMINPDDRAVLDNAISWSLKQLADSISMAEITPLLAKFETMKTEIKDIRDEEYVALKKKLGSKASAIVGLSEGDARSLILPLELNASLMNELTPVTTEKLSGIMSLYMIHNRSVLTDFIFLGFPFHYFYTAVFLLVLFVGLCWLYCVRIDKLNKFLNIQD